jgi:hypothetical protein
MIKFNSKQLSPTDVFMYLMFACCDSGENMDKLLNEQTSHKEFNDMIYHSIEKRGLGATEAPGGKSLKYLASLKADRFLPLLTHNYPRIVEQAGALEKAISKMKKLATVLSSPKAFLDPPIKSFIVMPDQVFTVHSGGHLDTAHTWFRIDFLKRYGYLAESFIDQSPMERVNAVEEALKKAITDGHFGGRSIEVYTS